MMENRLHLLVLKSKAFLLFLWLLAPTLMAQSWTAVDSMSIHSSLSAASTDAVGNLYLADKQGTLSRYSPDLRKQESFSEQQIRLISSLDADQLLRIFAFYEENQKYQLFNRFLNPMHPPRDFKLKANSRLNSATMSSDQMIWLVDETNFRLLKYNPILEEVILDTDLSYYINGTLQVNQLQEHNNRLFLHQQNEILVFDFMGNFISKLPLTLEGPFTFYGQTLYYCGDGQILVYDLASLQTTSTGFHPRKKINFMLSADDKLFLFSVKQLIVIRKNQ